jgi:hypothetical protein
MTYKISHIINGAVKKIYVFNGQYKNSKEALDTLFIKNPADARFADIFSPSELTAIAENAIQVYFISESLHLDDTIEIIKKKVLLHLIEDLNASFDELYFFVIQPRQFKAVTIYQNLTQNEKLELTKERLTQFLLNMDEIDVETLPEKDLYTYNDILDLNLEQSSFLTCKPLGQKLISLKDDYPYTVNPYYAEFYDPFLAKFADEIITTTNKNILMDHGAFLNNTIYLCTAEEVLTYGNDQNLGLSEEATLNIYFPYLSEKKIQTLEQLTERKQELLRETKDMLTPNFVKNIENVSLFYQIYTERKADLKFNDVGIKSISLIIYQSTEIHLPLDNVFKLIHATQDVPLIKMNLSKKKENIYRLYADKIATTGKKIPYLDKGVIFKWDKVMGKNKSVSVYIEHYQEESGAIVPILCEFNNNGSIVIKANFNTSLTVDAINELFQKEVNPVINIVKDYLAQDGYSLNNFVDLNHVNTEILNIEFALNIQIEKDINLKKIVGCLTSIFNVINDNLTNGIMLRFKRVSNYNEMESQEALILDMLQPQMGYSDNDIMKVLRTNFQLTEQAAMEKYAEVKSAQAIMETGNKKLKKKNNPGFLTTIVKQPYTKTVMINVSGINQIDYLSTLAIYIDSLIRITQNPASTKVSSTMIKNICAGKKTADIDKQVNEIIAHIDQPNAENLHMTIVANELVFNNPSEIVDEPIVAAEEAEEELDEDELLARFGLMADEDIEETGGARETGGTKKRVDDDEEDEEDGEDSDEDEEHLETDITGQSLSNPSPFEKRLRKYDKNLFVTDGDKKNFSSYATDCQMNRRRQPIVLTEEEKSRIDREHPGSYSEAIRYGSDPTNKFWYICPRYWDLKNNVSLTEEEIKKNNLTDKIIPKKPPKNKVPPGKYIFEFNDYGIEHLKDNKYITHYPGFLKPDDSGKCLPCCFKSWSQTEQTTRRAQCTKDNTIVVPPGRKKKKAAEEIDEYILAPDKFPITQENRFGYLPIAVQKFLHTDNKKCQISEMNTKLKDDHECLLRHSVEISQTQSFVACIADIWFESFKKIHKEKVKPTIKRMKEIFIETLTIDNFITLQNGNLLKIFYPNRTENADDALTDMGKYAEVFSQTNSKLYQMADKTNPSQMNALIKVARAYTNFIAYLKDDTVEIDYEYLWDLISKPNPKLFPKGINLVIIELVRKDISDSVELICPSNHYASTFFDPKKSMVLILKIDNFYEPIYIYKTNDEELTITRTFNKMDNTLMPNIKYVLNLINNSFNTKCGAMASMPTVYKFENNIPAEKLIYKLSQFNYTVEKQVMNYDSKIIGVVAINNQDNTKGFIPCYPSSAIMETNQVDIVYMTDAYADSYEETKDFLEKLYLKSKKQIPCKPYMKIIEDGLIVGLLTMTNQFVLLDEPTQDTFGTDLKVMNNTNYVAADEILATTQTVDTERVNYIKKIKLETAFYNVFRTTARYLLGQYQHNDIRREIEEKALSSQLYLKKLRSIETLLRELMKNYIQFHNYEENTLLELDTITNCYNNCEGKAYCQAITEGMCALLIPDTNLINQQSNDTFYFGKLADEIVRYSRVKSFIFNSKSVLSFSKLKYNLRENEIILSQSLLTQDYFENISAAKVNAYIKFNTFDTTLPVIGQKYLNVESYENVMEQPAEVIEDNCGMVVKEYIASKYWNAFFPLNSKEHVYAVNPKFCSFKAILTIINAEKQQTLTINEIKEILLNEYLKLNQTYGDKILQIFRAQGKKLLAGQIVKKQIEFTNMIMSEEYYATNLDVWLLAIYYDIPLILLSDTSLMENNGKYMVAHTPVANTEKEYYFLKVSATLPQLPPYYTLIINGENKMKIPIDTIRSVAIQTELRGAPPGNHLIRFIQNFSLTDANTRKKIIKVVPEASLLIQAPVPVEPMPIEPMPIEPVPVEPVPAAPPTNIKVTVKKRSGQLKIK